MVKIRVVSKYLWEGVLKIESVMENFHMHARSSWEHVILNRHKSYAVSKNLLFHGVCCNHMDELSLVKKLILFSNILNY